MGELFAGQCEEPGRETQRQGSVLLLPTQHHAGLSFVAWTTSFPRWDSVLALILCQGQQGQDFGRPGELSSILQKVCSCGYRHRSKNITAYGVVLLKTDLIELNFSQRGQNSCLPHVWVMKFMKLVSESERRACKHGYFEEPRLLGCFKTPGGSSPVTFSHLVVLSSCLARGHCGSVFIPLCCLHLALCLAAFNKQVKKKKKEQKQL